MNTAHAALLAVTSLLLLNGCGPATTGPVPLSGTVVWNGQPLADAALQLIPLDAPDRPIAGARIVDGRFTVEARGGVRPGRYRVEITAWRAVPPAGPLSDADRLMPVLQQVIPARWNSESELEIDVTGNRPRTEYDFQLTSTAPKS